MLKPKLKLKSLLFGSCSQSIKEKNKSNGTDPKGFKVKVE